MLAYAASRRRSVEHRPAPQAMLFILVGHIAVIAAVMSAKMDLPAKVVRTITQVELIDLPKPPDPKPQPQPNSNPPQSTLDRPPVIIPVPQPVPDMTDSRPVSLPQPGDLIGPRVDPLPQPDPGPKVEPAPVRVGPRFATPASAVRPPYPPSKIASEEEAVLRLRLSIDASGRVVGVEPVGRADPAFLAAARKHLLAKWRYEPATENGRAIASSTVITLRFQLD